jgi:hypothetical protein
VTPVDCTKKAGLDPISYRYSKVALTLRVRYSKVALTLRVRCAAPEASLA